MLGNHLAAFTTKNESGLSFVNLSSAVTQPFNLGLQGGIEIEIPYYARTHKLITRYTPSDSFEAVVSQVRQRFYPEGILSMSVASTRDNVVRVYRAVADDFNFGFLLGAPIVTVNESVCPVAAKT